MTYFLDTDICVFILRGKFRCRAKLGGYLPHNVKISSMVQAELLTGVRFSSDPLKTGREVEPFLSPYEIIPFDSLAATVYAEVRSALRRSGSPIGPADLVIASTALAHHGTLVTHNKGEFGRVPGLQIQDWTD